MSCRRQIAVVALTLLCAALPPLRAVSSSASAQTPPPPRYPLAEQYRQFNQPSPPTVPGVQAPPLAVPPGMQAAPGPQQFGPQQFGPQQYAPQQPGPQPPAIPPYGPPQAGPPPAVFEPAQVVARVGNLPILAGDLLGPINQALEPALGRVSDEVLAQQRFLLMQRVLPSVIETKMVYLDFRREIPDERMPDIQKQIFDQFDAKQLPLVMQKAGVSTPAELDAKLRSYGSSLYKTKCSFAEQIVAQQMVQRVVDLNPKFTHEELREYYRQHAADYRTEAQARWEQLMVRFDRFPDRAMAQQALAEMGNEVLLGAPLAAVARHKSHGFTAEQGGYNDWTIKGSLVSKTIDENLFTLPVGRLSRIIEDEQGLHILRVVERRDAAQVPFEMPTTVKVADSSFAPDARKPTATYATARIENAGASDVAVEATVYVRGEPVAIKKTVIPAFGAAQVEFELAEVNPGSFKPDDLKIDIDTQTRIRALLRQQHIEQQRKDYLAKLRARTTVWTIFGDLPSPDAGTASAPRNSPR